MLFIMKPSLGASKPRPLHVPTIAAACQYAIRRVEIGWVQGPLPRPASCFLVLPSMSRVLEVPGLAPKQPGVKEALQCNYWDPKTWPKHLGCSGNERAPSRKFRARRARSYPQGRLPRFQTVDLNPISVDQGRCRRRGRPPGCVLVFGYIASFDLVLLSTVGVVPRCRCAIDRFAGSNRTAAIAEVNAQIQAVNVFAAPALSSLHREIIAFAAEYRLPAIYQWKEHVDAGGLISYGPNLAAAWRQAATLVVKVLKGAKPADLPVEQPTRFELALNAKTAKSLGTFNFHLGVRRRCSAAPN
jgi:hypothetical protein